MRLRSFFCWGGGGGRGGTYFSGGLISGGAYNRNFTVITFKSSQVKSVKSVSLEFTRIL